MTTALLIVFPLVILSIILMFAWEGKMNLYFRLPVINLVVFVLLLVFGSIEQIILTIHPEQRTKYIKTSIFQIFF